MYTEAGGGHQVSCSITLYLIPWRQCLSLALKLPVLLGGLAKKFLPSSCLHPTTLELQEHTAMTASLWELEIQTQVLQLSQEALLPIEPSPQSPRVPSFVGACQKLQG